MIDVLLAVPDLPGETDLVVSAAACGVRVLRRCVDAADLLAAAAMEPAVTVVVSAGLPRLTASTAVAILAACRGPVLGLAPDSTGRAALEGLGLTGVLVVGPAPEATWSAVRAAVSDGVAAAEDGSASGVWSTGIWTSAPLSAAPTRGPSSGAAAEPAAPGLRRAPEGRLVAVWGPMGSPGRTTVALGLAVALSRAGRRVCLADADTYAPSVALALGMGEQGGLLQACRLAESGDLPATRLREAARQVDGGWHVLTGIPHADRWPDLRPAALERVWAACREAFDVTVVDVGFCVERDESPWSHQRNAVARTTLAAADRCLAVADASAQGAARLVGAWAELAEAAAPAPVSVVLNRARRDAGRGWAEAVREFGVPGPVLSIPDSAGALLADGRWARAPAEGRRRSPLRRSFVTLAEAVVSG